MNQNSSRAKDYNFPMQTHGDTQESYGEMYYMEPQVMNTTMSPVTQGRQTLMNRNQSPLEPYSKSIISTVKMDLRERTDTAQLIDDQPIKSLVVSLPSRGSSQERMERSPKTINIGDSREQAEYNIRTANVRRSPRGGVYQTYTNIEQGNIAMDQPMQYSGFIQGPEPNYQIGSNDSNVMISSMGGQIRHSPHGSIDGMNYGTMNPRQGRDPMLNRLSPNQNNIDDINSSGDKSYEPRVELNNIKNVLSNSGRMHVRYGNDMGNMNMNMNEMLGTRNSLNKDRMGKNSEVRYNNATYNNMTMGDVKKIVKRFTKVYDPKKTKEGTLINENQVTIPGADDDVFKGRYRVLQRMNRLSNILLSKRVENSPDRSDINNSRSFEDTRKTFDRHTLNRSTLQKKRMTINRSPEHKFLYLSLAMLSSKGPNTEDRIILRRMRFDKGGVVDLAQEKRKKGGIVIKPARPVGRTRGKSYINTNPKFREKAAKLIQAWWRELKEIYNERLNMIIKIQSFWRGRWVRKYMYDILYLSFMYQSFCQIIQKVLVKHVRPYVLNLLTEDQRNTKNLLKNLILKREQLNLLRIKPYLDRWVEYIKHSQYRNLKGRQLFDIRNNAEQRKNLLMQHFSKWSLLTKLMKSGDDANISKRQQIKFIGINRILDGLNKLSKRNALKNLKTKLLHYLRATARDKTLKNIIFDVNKKPKEKILRKYFNKWKQIPELHKDINMKRRISTELLTKEIIKRNKENLKDAFNKIVRKNPRQDVIEKIIIQERIVEKESKVKGIQKEFLLGADLLEKAILRLTFQYPLNAISDKIDFDLKDNKINKVFKIRKKYDKYLLKKYLDKWNNKSDKKGDKDILKKLLAKIIINYTDKLKNRILYKRFNQWKNTFIPKKKKK